MFKLRTSKINDLLISFITKYYQWKWTEKKLAKIKGTNPKSKNSKELIESLISVRQDTMCKLLTDDAKDANQSEDTLNDEIVNNSNYLDKKIHPGECDDEIVSKLVLILFFYLFIFLSFQMKLKSERQALTIEEQLSLLKADYLAKRTEMIQSASESIQAPSSSSEFQK